MSRRVILAPSPPRLKVSAPGYDPDSASDDNLLFDSTGGKYIGIAERGVVNVAWFTQTRFENIGGHYHQELEYTVNLAKSYAAPPHFLYCARDPNAPSHAGRNAVCINISFSNVGTTAGSRFRLYCETNNSQIRFFVKYFIMSLPVPATPFTEVAWIVFQK